MKKIVLLIFGAVVITLSAAVATARNWNEVSGKHFIVYFTQGKDLATDVLDKAEEYYRRIATELGYPRYSQFWTWENRVKIYIYPDHQSYLKVSHQPQWSEGMADYTNKEIISYAWSEDFTTSLLPHEMAHLIFRDFVGFKGEVPLWLDEGVAQWAEEAERKDMKLKAQELYENDGLLLLSDLMKLNMEALKNVDRVFIRPTKTKKGGDGVLFLSSENLVAVYYLEAVSLVGFLIEKYGSARFANFCRELRDGKSLEDALKFAYPAQIQSLEELEQKWRRYLAKGS